MNQLENHKGRFVTLAVNRSRSGTQFYCAKIQKITDKTVRFTSVNEGNRTRTVPISNLVDLVRID